MLNTFCKFEKYANKASKSYHYRYNEVFEVFERKNIILSTDSLLFLFLIYALQLLLHL